MPDTTERQIAVTPPDRPRGGVVMLFFGLVFCVAGTGLLLALLHSIETSPAGSALRSKIYLPVGFCSIFIVVGLVVALQGGWRVAARVRLARRAAEHAGEPWYGDYAWNPEGERERPLSGIGGMLVVVFVVLVMMLPFHYWAIAVGGAGMLWILIGIVDVLALAALGYVGLRVARKLRYGRSFIRYGTFPFFLGGHLDVTVGAGRPLPAGIPITATLRFVEERLRTYGNTPGTTFHQLWAEQKTLDSGLYEPRHGIRVEFPIPDGNYATTMSALYARFWQLQMHGDVPGADYDETFFLPIYRRG
jgi:hypothetical protein